MAVRAQQAKCPELAQRGGRVPGAGGRDHRRRRPQRRARASGAPSAGQVLGPGDAAVAGRQRMRSPRHRRRGGSPRPVRRSARRCGGPAQHRDAIAERALLQAPDRTAPVTRASVARMPGAELRFFGRRTDDVAQDGSDLDRGELVRVADEHELGVVADRLDEPHHQRKRHHRGLIDDHQVMGEAVARVVAEAPAGKPAEQPVDRRGAHAAADRLLQSCRGLAGRARTGRSAAAALRPPLRAPRSATTIRATVVVLPVPGPPAITARSRSSATAAAVRCSANSSAGNAARIASPSSARSPMSARMRFLAEQRCGEALLLAPVAVEVEPRADEPQRGRSQPHRPPTKRRARRASARRRPGRARRTRGPGARPRPSARRSAAPRGR